LGGFLHLGSRFWGNPDFELFGKENSLSLFSIHERNIIPYYTTSSENNDDQHHYDLRTVEVDGVFHYILYLEALIKTRTPIHQGTVKICRKCYAKFYDRRSEKTAADQLLDHKN
jgi:hypothetical protein